MRLSRLQAIHQYRYSSFEQFIAKLLKTNGLEACCGYVEPIGVEADEDLFYEQDLPKADNTIDIRVIQEKTEHGESEKIEHSESGIITQMTRLLTHDIF